MKSFNLFFFILVLSCQLSAQSIDRVLNYNAENSLNNYLKSIMHKQYNERKKDFKKALRNKKSITNYQNSTKKKYLHLLNTIPENYKDTLPSIVYCGKYIDSSSWNYQIEKIILEKRITATIYTPKEKGKKPAILFFCGHEQTGKATASYQKIAILLANHGFVVMVIDPIGQGERVQLINSEGEALTPKATSEHTILNMGAILVGSSIVKEELLDNILCLNYLLTLPNIDKENIGCLGNSGGGTQATYFSAYENRIKAVACCSWFTTRERMFEKYGPDDGCQYLANEGSEKLEIADYYIMQAPRPTLILAGKKDFIDYQGTIEAYNELSAVYKKLNSLSNISLFSVDDGHGISKQKREESVRFFTKHLLQKNIQVEETEPDILSENKLQCTNTGQIHLDFPTTKNLQEKLIDKSSSFDITHKVFNNKSLVDNIRFIKKEMNVSNKYEYKSKKISEPIKNGVYKETKYIIEKKNEIDLPLRVLSPHKWASNAEAFLILHDEGMSTSKSLKVINDIVKNGNCVILADIRGIGETKDQVNKNNKKFYSEDYRNASLALFIGKPLLSQRVEDVVSIIDFITDKKNFNNKEFKSVNCFGYGKISLALRVASYLDNRIAHTATKNDILSWKEIIKNPTIRNRMGLIVPNVLQHFDINCLRRYPLK